MKTSSIEVYNIAQLAEMFYLPSWDVAEEVALHAGDTEDALNGVFESWYDTVLHIASTLFAEHGLELAPHEGIAEGEKALIFKVVPITSWAAAADAIRTAVNSINEPGHAFPTLGSFLSSGPYTPKEAVLAYLAVIAVSAPARATYRNYLQ